MTAPSPFERILAARVADRHRTARGLAARIVSDVEAQGRAISLIGSLATGRFRLHSDIDLLVRGPIDPAERAAVERAVAAVMRGTGIPNDLIYACDLTPSQLDAFEKAVP